MSTQVATSNAAITRKMFEAFQQGDIPFILKQLSEECEWNVMGAPYIPHAGKFIGSGTGLFFTKMDEDVAFTSFDVHNIYEVSDTDVLSTGRFEAIGRKTGKKASSPWVMLTRFRDGKLIHFQDYYDSVQLAKAMEQ